MTATGEERDGRGLGGLLDVVWSLPAPTSPPPVAHEHQAFGLALLDLSLRLRHVNRVSERLRLVDRGHLERAVELDLDLDALGHEQLATLHARRRSAGPGDEQIWLPIARHRREDVTPLLVRDAGGAVLPRLTHHDATRRIAAGLIRLFRLQVAASPDASVEGHPLHDLRHRHARSRWLIEHAILRFVDDGGSGALRAAGLLVGGATREPVPRSPYRAGSLRRARATDQFSIRAHAEEGLRLLLGADPAFPHLLDLAAREYLVVVRVPRDADRAFLGYAAPLLPARAPAGSAVRLARSVLPLNREFRVEYAATMPRAVPSYHLTVEVPDEVRIRRFTVSSDIDAPVVRSLLDDVEAVAAEHEALTAGGAKLLELELQSIAFRLAELGRRRFRDAAAFRDYLRWAGGDPAPAAEPEPFADATDVLRRLRAGDCSPTVLAAFAGHHEADAYRPLRAWLDAPVLTGIAGGLRSSGLGHDVSVDNDPRENGGHVQWRSPLTPLTAGSLEPVRVRAYLSLADESPSLVESVSRMVLALTGVVWAIGALLAGSSAWLWRTPPGFDAQNAFARADAVVAVLLLVPGILVTRLDTRQTNTVLGQIRRYQTALAYTALVATTGLALAVAASPPGRALVDAARVAFAVLVVLLVACATELVVGRRRRRALVPPTSYLPEWLNAELRPGRPRRVVAPDARFEALETT